MLAYMRQADGWHGVPHACGAAVVFLKLSMLFPTSVWSIYAWPTRIKPHCNMCIIASEAAGSDQAPPFLLLGQTVSRTIPESGFWFKLLPEATADIMLLLLQAVAQTANIEKGNVQLKKAIKLSTSARKFTAVLMVVASLLMLGFDWYAS